MNRTLKRPMFRMGGSTGTGITSGLDQPRKQYAQGTNPYAMGNFAPGTGAGFLTSFGLDLLSRTPTGNIFQTAATSAREPFKDYQAAQFRMGEKMGERDFLRSETDRKIEAADTRLDKELASREKIAGMKDEDVNVMAYAEIYKDSNGAPNIIKGKNAVEFFETGYNELGKEFGVESVAVEPIDASVLQTQKALKLFRKQNPGAEGKVFYDVASGKAVKLAKDAETGDLALIPATGVVDTEGDDMPEPNTTTPGLFNQKTKPDIITPKIKELGEEFSEEIYQTP